MVIKSSKRIESVSEYYFSRKLKEIAALNASGCGVIGLGIGSPDLPPADEVIDALCRAAKEPDMHGYQPYTGIVELRTAFAKWYTQWYGVNLEPNSEILPLIGSKEGIFHISMAFLNAGDGVLVPNPGYPAYSAVSRLLEADTVEYDLKEENGWQPDFDALEQTDLSKIKLMWVNYPNMPTGAAASSELFERLVDFGRRHNIVICHDNPYSFILNNHPRSILEVENAKEICIELNSLSKSHNMPGWRIGMLASNSRFIEWILRVKSNIDSGQFRPAMLAAACALRAPSEWYLNINAAYSKRRRIAEAIMDALDCRFDAAQSGLFLWGKIPAHCANSEEFADKILRNSYVFVTPGFIFGSNGDRYIRLSLCASETVLQNALDRVSNLCK
jgi:aspartate/methionine/tyrosine aminotransferase